MAINTASKRRSVSGVLVPTLIPGVTPNASKPAAWRQSSGWSYNGIAAESAPTFVHDVVLWRGTGQTNVSWSGTAKPNVSWRGNAKPAVTWEGEG